MKRLMLAVLLAGSALSGVAHADPCVEWWQPLSHPPVHEEPCHAPPGGPTPGGPQGRKCAFNSATDVTREAGWQIGVINAGPLVTGEAGTLYCEIHVNNNDHSGPYSARESAAAVGVAVVMEPRELHYQATAADTISLCTIWAGVNGTLYWHGNTNPLLSWWDTDPTNCGEALSIEPNDPECRIWHSIDNRLGTNIAEIWQDCEEYPPII